MMVMSAEALLDWIMDSGGSYYMTPSFDLFSDFLECDGGRVLLGDNRECKIRGIGKVRLQRKDGSSFVLHNVGYIPKLKRNLISLGTLEKEGYTIKLQSGKIKVINGSRIVLFGTRKDNCVYSLDGHAVAGELNASVEEKDSHVQVWHKRLGHISEAGLQVLEKQGLFGKKSLGKLNFCENCILGMSYRVSFGVGRHITQGVIDYVHSDLWGPSQVESLGGKRYFLSIVDDYSKRVWVYLLRFKHEAFEKFKEWKQLVENQTGRTVKKLRTDNGLELCNREFKQLCIESGIPRHLTVSGLPKTIWAEATCTAAYLINRSPSTAIEKKTPMEMWSGHPSDYGMLRTFGCVTYSHVQQVTSRNVVFNESVMYKDTLKDSGAGADKSVEELQVEVELQRLNNHTLEEDQTNNKDQTDQDDGDDEDAGDQEIDQPPDLIDYQLVRDREPRTRTKPLRFRDESNMAAYAFAVAEEEDTHEPLTYQEAVSYEDIRHTSIRIILALTACKDFELEQLDVKTAFLHGNLEEVIYMKQPRGYEQGNKLCLLKKSLYGLKQSPRQWYRRFDEYILSNGFKRSSYDICVYYRSYAPDIAYAVSIVSRYMANLGKNHWEAVKWILKYLRGTANVGLIYGTNRGNHKDVTGFVDSDYAKDPDKEAVKEAIWLRGLLEELGVELNKVTFNCDNQARFTYRGIIHRVLVGNYYLPLISIKRGDAESKLIISTVLKCLFDAVGLFLRISLEADSNLIAGKVASHSIVYGTLVSKQSKAEIGSTKSLLKREFDMKDLREAKKILGMEIVRDWSRKILRVSQFEYISKILNNFRIDNGKSVQMPLGRHFKLSLKDCPIRDCDFERMSKVPYENAVGSLMYLMVCTRPDIAYTVSIVSRYLANPGKNHWEAVKSILKYLRGNANVGLIYGTNRGNHKDVIGFVDLDYAKDPNKGRSITGYAFLVQGCVVSWKATLQHVV
nr:copia LTR rider [Tanacetum cinerariifolium]